MNILSRNEESCINLSAHITGTCLSSSLDHCKVRVQLQMMICADRTFLRHSLNQLGGRMSFPIAII